MGIPVHYNAADNTNHRAASGIFNVQYYSTNLRLHSLSFNQTIHFQRKYYAGVHDQPACQHGPRNTTR